MHRLTDHANSTQIIGSTKNINMLYGVCLCLLHTFEVNQYTQISHLQRVQYINQAKEDRAKYITQGTIRKLIRRPRRVDGSTASFRSLHKNATVKAFALRGIVWHINFIAYTQRCSRMSKWSTADNMMFNIYLPGPNDDVVAATLPSPATAAGCRVQFSWRWHNDKLQVES